MTETVIANLSDVTWATLGGLAINGDVTATGTVSPFTTTVVGLQGIPISATAPTSAQVLQYSSSTGWTPTTLSFVSTTLTSAHIYVGNGSNVATSVAVSGDLTLANTGAFTVAAAAVSLAKMANLAANTFIGNNTASPATPIALTIAQTTAALNLFTSSLQGLVPGSGGGTTNFLRADGTWATPSGSGTVNSGTSGQMTYYASTGTAVSGTANATISNGAMTLGVNASVAGSLLLANGGGSGTSITIQNLGNTTAYNFNLPIAAGTSGYFLTSGGGSSTSMTWTAPYSLPAATSSTLGGVKPDGTTISNSTGAISLNLGNANTWTAVQTFTNSDFRLLGSSTGYTTFTSANSGSSNFTLTFPAVTDTVMTIGTTAQAFSGGVRVTSYSNGTKSSGTFTPDPGNGPLQYVTNGGAHTLANPSYDGSFVLLYTNNGSAGTITFSGFTVGSNTGDTLDTTNTHKFMIQIVTINSVSTYTVKALQ